MTALLLCAFVAWVLVGTVRAVRREYRHAADLEIRTRPRPRPRPADRAPLLCPGCQGSDLVPAHGGDLDCPECFATWNPTTGVMLWWDR